jgi:hypothetical protein
MVARTRFDADADARASMLYDLFSSRSWLRAHVVPRKPVEESVQHSQGGKNKAYSVRRCWYRGATVFYREFHLNPYSRDRPTWLST